MRPLHRGIGVTVCVIIAASLFLPWSTFDFRSSGSNRLEPSTAAGIEHDGGVILLVAVVAVGALIWMKDATTGTRVVSMVTGLVVACFGWVDFADSRQVLSSYGVEDGITGSIGIGLYLFIAAGLALAASAVPS